MPSERQGEFADRSTASRCSSRTTSTPPIGCGRAPAPSRSRSRSHRAMRSSPHGSGKPGAVILGKTNLSEWANFRSTRSTSGWSGRGGQTKNPYVLDRNPCGSSSGTGASISANLAAVGIGTETDGSIVCPSSANGLVGIKPTVGLVSRSGIIPISHSQDTAGPMARTVDGRRRTARRAERPGSARSGDGSKPRQDRRVIRERAESRRAQGRAHWRRAKLLRLQRRGGSHHGRGDRRHEVSRRDHRRPGEHRHRRQVRRRRGRGAELRVQGGPERISRRVRPVGAAQDARRPHRVQRPEQATARCRTSARSSSSRHRPKDR